MKKKLDADYVRSILDYNPETGIFTWKWRNDAILTWNARWVGQKAGTNPHRSKKRNNEKLPSYIVINKIHYQSHCLAWLYMTGEWPKYIIDHKDLNPWNNKWDNLRKCTPTQNQFNRKIQSNNTSGYKGVCWDKNKNKWMAWFKVNRKMNYIGHFNNIEAAIKARLNAVKYIHGEFMRIA